VYQYDFPDTAEFNACLLDPDAAINESMEIYCKLVLLLFFPYRILADITIRGSYTLRLREAVATGIIGQRAQTFLQNLQDARSNSLRVNSLQDDLQRDTEPFVSTLNFACDGHNDPTSDDENNTHLQGQHLEELLTLLDMEADSANTPKAYETTTPSSRVLPPSISLKAVRQKGTLNCGYESLATMSLNLEYCNSVTEVQQESSQPRQSSQQSAISNHLQQTAPNQRDIASLLITRTARRSRTFAEITQNCQTVHVLEPNGSARSIIDWADKAQLDRGQRRAFEIMASTFVLGFYRHASTTNSRGQGVRHLFTSEKSRLEKLAEVRRRQTDQLICLLHGPGGSGKTTVIDLMMEYAREYCALLDNYEFNSSTIILTAMTGVTATILLGEMTHLAVYLNQRKPIQTEQVELWESTRLLIIDEISFASKEDFAELHRKLR
jgi:DNA replication protein DnaC